MRLFIQRLLRNWDRSRGVRLGGTMLMGLVLANHAGAAALRVAVIGDSLSAEYDALPGIPGIEDPTAYAAVTVAGWESRSWVEVLGLLRGGSLDLGPHDPTLPGWNDFRFTGYKYNFAIPGFQASQYEDIVNSSFFSNPQYLLFRSTLGDVLRHDVDACVVWIGANEFRANYGFLYDGGDPASLIQNLRHDIGEILDFVREQNAALRILVVNLPDLGATPSKQAAHPDPAKRDRVSQATMLANQAISELAGARGLPVTDAFAATRRVMDGQGIWYGPVDIRPESHPDNDPRYAFTREGLHPNTGLQLEIARLVIATLNEHYATTIPPITDTEALRLLGINPQQPYLDWVAAHALGAGAMEEDLDQDGLVNLVEFVFGFDPKVRNASPLSIESTLAGVEAGYHPDPARSRFASVVPERSTDLMVWNEVPPSSLITAADGRVSFRFPVENSTGFLRLRVVIRVVD